MATKQTKPRKPVRLRPGDIGPVERYTKGDKITIATNETEAAGVRRARVETKTIMDRYLAHKEVTKRQHDAASKLYRDWKLCGGEPSVVANYSGEIGGGVRDDERNLVAGIAYQRAIEAIGKRPARIVVHVVLLDKPAGDWAKANNVHPIGAIALLRQALDSLGDYYVLPDD